MIIDLEGLHIKNLALSTPHNSQLQLLGLFSEKNSSNAKGRCSFSVAIESFVLEKKHKQNFPQDIYDDMYSERKAKKKKKKELVGFNIDYVLHDNKQNTYLLAENFYISESPGMPMGPNGMMMTGGSSTPNYDDILIIKFNTNGEMAWGRSLFKRSKEHSYNAFLKEDQLHIILNSGKNLIQKKDGRTKISKIFLEFSGDLYDFTFSEKGDMSHYKIHERTDGSHYSPQYGSYNNGSFVMFGTRKREKVFAILE